MEDILIGGKMSCRVVPGDVNSGDEMRRARPLIGPHEVQLPISSTLTVKTKPRFPHRIDIAFSIFIAWKTSSIYQPCQSRNCPDESDLSPIPHAAGIQACFCHYAHHPLRSEHLCYSTHCSSRSYRSRKTATKMQGICNSRKPR
jgi:hypothetical protein